MSRIMMRFGGRKNCTPNCTPMIPGPSVSVRDAFTDFQLLRDGTHLGFEELLRLWVLCGDLCGEAGNEQAGQATQDGAGGDASHEETCFKTSTILPSRHFVQSQ